MLETACPLREEEEVQRRILRRIVRRLRREYSSVPGVRGRFRPWIPGVYRRCLCICGRVASHTGADDWVVKKPWHQLTVEGVDSLTFRCESESGHSPYFVDAATETCDCKDYQCRIAPVKNGTKKRPMDENWIPACKHILAVKLKIADQLLDNIRKQKYFKPQTI